MALFSSREKRELKRNGFVVKHDVIDEETIAAAQDAFWSGVPFDRDDYDALVDAPERFENAWEHIQDPEPFVSLNEQLLPYAEELAGEGALLDPGESIQVTPRFPNGELRETGDLPSLHRESGHIDGYGPQFDATHEVGYHTVMTSVYLEGVQPRGGGFTVWPGSHWYAGEYYSDHHLESLVDDPSLPAYEDGEWDRCGDLAQQMDPLEIYGDAGTTVFWHQNLLHCGGINRSPNVRLAAIQRFQRRDADDIKRDAYANPWKYWEGMEDVEIP
ncbi:phytanoyl-CoA dioxygenase family protein [Halococcus agarilyticus]|uniref:phytanoyl-CoA dioxygenase family protein n=1 Tax=Halococcus agarilyticus TaxID=1232219 RepID=UPI000677AB3E|nr:phytanoyl-CoA dioxygenase family protein [Halococcus agarilyticus]